MSTSSVSVVAIAGLTGRMSRSIANHILQTKQDVMIHGIMRDPSKLPANLKDSPNVKTFQAAADEKEKLREALKGADVCICGYSAGKDVMLDGQKTLIDACIESGVKRYIASDWSIDYRDLALGEIPLKDNQKLIAAYLDEHASQIQGVHVLTSAFMEALFLAPLGIVDVATHTFKSFGDGTVKWELATYDDAGRFTAELACDPTAVGFFNIIGDQVTIREVAEAFGRVYGVETKLLQGEEDLEKMREQGLTVYKEQPQNVAGWAFPLGIYLMQSPGRKSKCKTNDVGKYPGMGKTTSVEEFMSKHEKEGLTTSGKF